MKRYKKINIIKLIGYLSNDTLTHRPDWTDSDPKKLREIIILRFIVGNNYSNLSPSVTKKGSKKGLLILFLFNLFCIFCFWRNCYLGLKVDVFDEKRRI